MEVLKCSSLLFPVNAYLHTTTRLYTSYPDPYLTTPLENREQFRQHVYIARSHTLKATIAIL